MNQILIW